jgi:replication factor A1
LAFEVSLIFTFVNVVSQINPDMDQSHQLKGWYETEGSTASITTLTMSGSRGGGGASDFGSGSNMKTFAEAKQENIGMNSDKAEYFSATGMVAFIKKDNALYQGCANQVDGRSCNKKVGFLTSAIWS